jgi:hypothetical protein
VPDLSVSGDNFDLAEDDPCDPTTTSKPEAPMQQAPVKISDFLNNRAKSYARFKEGTSSYG